MKIPLNTNTIGLAEKKAINDVLDSGYVTMGKITTKFEKKFSEYVGTKHAIFVNSGSSANLLAFSAIQDNDKLRKVEEKSMRFLKKGDEVIVPAVTWSTTIWPIAQTGGTAVFVDSDPRTLQMKTSSIKNALSEKTRAICVVHVLGNSGYIEEINKICKENDLWLIEDTCESLGVTNKNKYLGTFGDIGTYSFYFSHHITTIEGGMIVTNNDYLANKIKSMRSHGWTRDMMNAGVYERQFPEIDPRFLFVNVGYNLRSTDINAAIGLVQLKKLKKYNEKRNEVGNAWNAAFAQLKKQKYLTTMEITEHTSASWFGFPVICNNSEMRDHLGIHLEKNGIETRPIICGNMIKQPGIRNIKHRISGNLKGADIIMKNGIFWGNSPGMKKAEIDYVIKIVNGFFE